MNTDRYCKPSKLSHTKIPPFFKLSQGGFIGDSLPLKAMKSQASFNFCLRYSDVNVTTN